MHIPCCDIDTLYYNGVDTLRVPNMTHHKEEVSITFSLREYHLCPQGDRTPIATTYLPD